MKRAAALLLAALPLVLVTQLRAEDPPKHPVKPMLWKIEGGKLTKPSHLFGTIHLGSGPLAKLHPAAETAFDASDIVYTEIPMDPKTQLEMTQSLIRKDGKTLAQAIGKELSGWLDEELKEINPQLDSAPFQPMKTWVAPVIIETIECGLKGETPLDLRLWNRAEKAGKQTAALETAASHVELFDSFSEEEQVALLRDTLETAREDRKSGHDPKKDLIEAYVAGDADNLDALMEKQTNEMLEGKNRELGEKLMKKVLEDRDLSMAKTIAEKLAEKPDQAHFFAAGAGHFVGRTSIISELEKKGYRISRVER